MTNLDAPQLGDRQKALLAHLSDLFDVTQLARKDAVPAAYRQFMASFVLTNENLQALAAETGYVWTLVDDVGHVAFGVAADGSLTGKFVLPAESVKASMLDPTSVVAPVISYDESLVWAVVDQADRAALGVMADGTLVGKFPAPADGTITIEKLATSVSDLLGVSLAVETGYTWVLADSAGHRAIGVLPDGSVELKLANPPDTAGTPSVSDGTSLVTVVKDSSGNRQLQKVTLATGQAMLLTSVGDNASPALNADGSVFYRSKTSDSEGYVDRYVPAGGGAPWRVLPTTNLADWGDSMTAGGQGGGAPSAWSDAIAADLGVAAYNGGISSQTSTEVSLRQGGTDLTCTVAGGSIPASGPVAVTVTAPTSSWRSGFAWSFVGALAGVAGVMAKDTANAWTFTRTAPGAVVAAPAGSVFHCTAGDAYVEATQILWVGRNNTVQAEITRDVAAMVAHLKPYAKRFLVLPVWNTSPVGGAGEPSGSGGYSNVMAINAALAAAYPNNYTDLRRWVIDNGLADQGLAPTTADAAAVAADQVPPSLMADSLHPNAAGRSAVAHRIAAVLRTKGWY